MRGERVGQPQMRRQLRAVCAGAEDPDRRLPHPRRAPPAAPGRVPSAGNSSSARPRPRETGRRRRSDCAASPAPRSGPMPGARPSPRSIRPGCSAASVPNCSAISSGAWFGSMMPPAPMRMVRVADRHMRQRHRRRRAGDPRHVVVLRHPEAPVAQRLRMTGEVDRIAQRLAGVAAFGNRGEIEDGQWDHPHYIVWDAPKRNITVGSDHAHPIR